MNTWTTEIIANGETNFNDKLTDEQIKKLVKYANNLLKPPVSNKGAIKAVSVSLSQAGRFMRATYKDQDWTTDSFMAIRGAEYAPTKKSVTVSSNSPSLDDIVENIDNLTLVESLETDDDRYKLLLSTGNYRLVNPRYHNAILKMFPGSKAYFSDVSTLSPVNYYKGNELVALLMPLKA